MIDYNPKEWFRFIFNFHKADTVRKLLPLIGVISLYATALAWLLLDYLGLQDNSDLKNISQMHSLLGFVISMLLVFRTNTAYDRWWEGRKAWGALVNNSRNLALKINSLLSDGHANERAFFAVIIPNFAYSLKNHLRSRQSVKGLKNCATFDCESLDLNQHLPNQVSQLLFAKVCDLQVRGTFRAEHLLILNAELQSFADICGACERIKNTPIPFSYSSFLKKFIFFYCLTLPIGYVFTLHYLVVPFVVFIFYVLASLEVIAEEIEDPFGTDANDLPADSICANIRKSVEELLGSVPELPR